MSIDNYGDNVRVRFTDDWRAGDDVIVERLSGSEWIRVAGFNSMADDYAYTNAAGIARKLQAQYDQIAREQYRARSQA